ncbi:cyclophilin-like fold protein [Helicobacter sp. MIT 21-1697]|uniref:cyclophilin-like fold protein n=1 Tax=Helicobacter sp. MIT 21-1697 TaxID=2993733 RepID=UPI00224A85CB|nr:cyclophilin-like fold protein [Helicobacter sp. MIT 21-1697]MCX2717926.1 cyclophilin-like fold protein [Helicobacter sp. MIT 21-1697]
MKFSKILCLCVLLMQCTLGECFAQSQSFGGIDSRAKEEQMQIQMHFGGQSFVLGLENNAVAKEFYALLPLSLNFSDYVGKEKIAKLDTRLSAQEGVEYEPQSGDFFYFVPWGNVGLFYAKQPPYPGVIKLGSIKGARKSFVAQLKAQKQDFILTIEKYPSEKQR